jgi:uncharacterized membrane protein YeaQ/YmgE (transglycosylase-associated protein family)
MSTGLSVIVWIVAGALVGWLASRVAGTERGPDRLDSIVVGAAGAALGGILTGVYAGQGTFIDGSIIHLAGAVAGAIAPQFASRLVCSRL